jgi:hypothetical protein
VIIFPVPERIIRTDKLSSWQTLHIGFLACGLRTIMLKKAMWKPLQVSLLRKIVNKSKTACLEELHKSFHIRNIKM